jgi:surface polysaccharide O-acyltransferase-like enzyme
MEIIDKPLVNNNFSEKGIKNIFHKEKPRNYGIDLLRFFSMINIINLHINLKTGFLFNSNNFKFKKIWILETFSYFSVDCFGLISGIVGFDKYKFSNLIYLWFISAFYCVSRHLYLYMKNKINIKALFLSFFPILIKYHWYVNAYFIMYLFLPFINFGIKEINKKTFKYLVVFYIFFFSIYYIIQGIFKTQDYNFLLNGYSSSWLTILYIIGSYFGKYTLKSIDISSRIVKIMHIINYIGFSLLSSEIFFITKKKLLISYLSPTILFQALSLVMIFSSIKITNKLLIKIIKFITPLT